MAIRTAALYLSLVNAAMFIACVLDGFYILAAVNASAGALGVMTWLSMYRRDDDG